MLVVVSYDVATTTGAGKRRLRKVSQECLNFGQRVQNSVFECVIDPTQWATLKGKLLKIIKEEEDSLRFYFLGANWKKRIEHVGAKPSLEIEGPLIA
jgi:CRISPR-associated protein Cas2